MMTIACNDRTGEFTGSAIRFWELARFPFNAILLMVVIGILGVDRFLILNLVELMTLSALGIVANIFYCTGYLPDLMVQMSDMGKGFLLIVRAAVWTVGTAFATMLTFFSFHDGTFVLVTVFQ